MKHALFVLMFIFILPLAADGADVHLSEEYDNNNTVVKTVGGVRFETPEDRPIEKWRGFTRVMPIDEYISMKFSKVEDRLQKIEDSLDAIKNDLTAAKEDIKLLKKEGDTR